MTKKVWTPPFHRAAGNYDPDEASRESAFRTEGESMTIQSETQDTDINVLVQRFGITGMMPQAPLPPTYGDFDNVNDYHSALNMINEANRSFMNLSADIRAKFDNDAGRFVDFCADPKNLDEMREMGLAVPKVVEPAPQKVEIVNKSDDNKVVDDKSKAK